MSDPTERNYSMVQIDEEKRLVDYSTNERRKFLIDEMKKTGVLPSDLNFSEYADMFDVSVQTISDDFAIISDWMKNELGDKEEELAHRIFLDGAKRQKDRGNDESASRILERYARWLEARGYKDPEKTADAKEVNVNLSDEVIDDE